MRLAEPQAEFGLVTAKPIFRDANSHRSNAPGHSTRTRLAGNISAAGAQQTACRPCDRLAHHSVPKGGTRRRCRSMGAIESSDACANNVNSAPLEVTSFKQEGGTRQPVDPRELPEKQRRGCQQRQDNSKGKSRGATEDGGSAAKSET